MAGKLDLEDRMTIKALHRRGLRNTEIARSLGVTEGAVRYHVRRQESGAEDGRTRQRHRAEGFKDAIAHWLEATGDEAPLNLTLLHEWLAREQGYPGSLRSLQRYFKAQFPAPRRRARRRVETPPGAQSQVDWAHFPRVRIAGEVVDLYAFDLELSWSRYDALIWSERKDQLSWHHVHNEAFRRIGGVTATVRADNEKTAVVRGAGAWGQINDAYRRYAWCVHFHIDLCPPRMPRYKGKIERRIRDRRNCIDPRSRSWECLEELQVCSDEAVLKSAERRICPLTGTSVREAYEQELAYLQPLPLLPEPFDIVVSRRVSVDCLVSFEGRRMSVPFHYVDRMVEVRGCARKVQILADGRIVASWPRYTKERLLIDPRHYEGEGTGDILPPPPLGRMGRRLQEIADLPPESRPLDLYAALAEVAR